MFGVQCWEQCWELNVFPLTKMSQPTRISYAIMAGLLVFIGFFHL
jgi:hypothetical protein